MIGASSARRPRALEVLAALGWHAFTPLGGARARLRRRRGRGRRLLRGPGRRLPLDGHARSRPCLAVVSVAIVRITRLDPTFGRWLAGMSLTFCIYAALPPWLNGLAGPAIDPLLEWSERALFGTTLAQVLDPYVGDGLTLFWALAYSMHVPLFFILPLIHWRAGRRARAERLLLTLTLAMYLGFVGYALFPALGPVGAMTGLRPLGSNLATETVANYGVALGTFPSLHAGVCAAVAIDGWRTSRRLGSRLHARRGPDLDLDRLPALPLGARPAGRAPAGPGRRRAGQAAARRLAARPPRLIARSAPRGAGASRSPT